MKINLTSRQQSLLCEAARRWVSFQHRGETLTTMWTGLGSRTTYKPVADAGLMRADGDYPPRGTCWWVLTEQGAAIVDYWLKNDLIEISGYEITKRPPRQFEM